MKDPMDIAVNRWLAYRDRVDSMLVRGDRRQIRRQMIGVGVKFALGLAFMLAITSATDVGLLALPLGLLVGTLPMQNLARAQCYRSGWIDGRRVAFTALAEAQRRDLSLGEWLDGELERDLQTFL